MYSVTTRGRARALRSAAFALGALLVLGACRHVPHHRHDSGDPDVRLATALRQLDKARSTGRNNNVVRDDERVIVDSGAAVHAIEQLALEFPEHGPTLLANADIAFRAREMEKAQQYLDRLLENEPDNVFAGILRAEVSLYDGNLPQARRIIEEQIEIVPDSPHLHETLASIHFFSGDYAAADRSLLSAGHLGSAEWRVAYHRGLVAERRGDVEGARRHYRHASELNGNFAPARARLVGLEPVPDAPAGR